MVMNMKDAHFRHAGRKLEIFYLRIWETLDNLQLAEDVKQMILEDVALDNQRIADAENGIWELWDNPKPNLLLQFKAEIYHGQNALADAEDDLWENQLEMEKAQSELNAAVKEFDDYKFVVQRGIRNVEQLLGD